MRTDIPLNSTLLQLDLDNVSTWAREWQLNLSINKCFVLHAARNPRQIEYTLDNTKLTISNHVKDLGVFITSNLKPSLHCQKITLDALKVSACIFRNFSVKQLSFLRQMFLTFVRPKVEYASVVWSPWLKKDINMIEKTQKWYSFRLKIQGSYKERLNFLELESLELRRLYTDLVEVFKIFHGSYGLIRSEFFKLGNSRTRRHHLKIFKEQTHCDERKFFFSNRIIDAWNSLSEETINAQSINVFKKFLRKSTKLLI
jgi:hypothetical protein